jgi:hypothetical protein
VYVTVAPDALVALTVMFAVPEFTGGVVSRIVTWKLPGTALLPAGVVRVSGDRARSMREGRA